MNKLLKPFIVLPTVKFELKLASPFPNNTIFFSPFCIIFKQLSTPLISKCAILPELQLLIYVPPYTFNTLSEFFIFVS